MGPRTYVNVWFDRAAALFRPRSEVDLDQVVTRAKQEFDDSCRKLVGSTYAPNRLIVHFAPEDADYHAPLLRRFQQHLAMVIRERIERQGLNLLGKPLEVRFARSDELAPGEVDVEAVFDGHEDELDDALDGESVVWDVDAYEGEDEGPFERADSVDADEEDGESETEPVSAPGRAGPTESETETESEPMCRTTETESETETDPTCRTTESESESEPTCRTTESESESEPEPVCRTTEPEAEADLDDEDDIELLCEVDIDELSEVGGCEPELVEAAAPPAPIPARASMALFAGAMDDEDDPDALATAIADDRHTRCVTDRAVFEVVGGPTRGKVHMLSDGIYLVGRHQACELQLPVKDDLSSRRHMRIIVRGDSVAVDDLQSGNGTYVNGRRVHHARLNTGDVVRAGRTDLRLTQAPGGWA